MQNCPHRILRGVIWVKTPCRLVVNFSHFVRIFCLRIQRNRQARSWLLALSRILLLHSSGKYAVPYAAHLRTFRRTPIFASYAVPNVLKKSIALIFIGLDCMVGDETIASFFVRINSTVRSSKVPEEPALNTYTLAVTEILTNYFYVFF